MSAIEKLLDAIEETFGPGNDPDEHWPDDEDVTHPPSGITFGMIRAARTELELTYGKHKPGKRSGILRSSSEYCDEATDSSHSSSHGLNG
jgi:hypothetical protein